MRSSTVDILMATYNGERYLAEQIESIQRQTYRDWRLLISDDCSTDDTLDVVYHYAAKDPRISVVSKGVRYGGSKQNFMHLMRLSSAGYAMFCDQDDIWHRDKVEREMEELHAIEVRRGKECPIMVHSDLELVDAEGEFLGKLMSETTGISPITATAAQMIVSGVATGCAMAMNRACIVKSLEFSCIENILMHDWWVALVACMLGERSYIDVPLVSYRQHGSNVIGAAIKSPGEMARDYAQIQQESGASGVRNHIVEGEIRRIAQAREFLVCYQSELTSDRITELEAVMALSTKGLLNRFETLNAYRLWCRGLKRKFRQLLAMVMMS